MAVALKIALKVDGPPARCKPISPAWTSRCAALAVAAAASWGWPASHALAQGAPKVRIITGNGDFLVDLRPATVTPTGPAGQPQTDAFSGQASAASPSEALLAAPASLPADASLPLPVPLSVPISVLLPVPLPLTILAQEPGPAPAPTSELAIAAALPAPDTPAVAAPMNARPTADNVVESAAESTAEAVQVAVRRWAGAWAGQDLNAYFASYGQGFAPAGNQARKSWETSRRARIASKSHISVTLSDLAIAVQGSVATARFKQNYSAGALNISGRKMLELTQDANQRWVIVKETAGR